MRCAVHVAGEMGRRGSIPGPRLPVGPLMVASGVGTVRRFADLVGTQSRAVERALLQGLTYWQADVWACRAGMSVWQVWGVACCNEANHDLDLIDARPRPRSLPQQGKKGVAGVTSTTGL